MRVTPRQETAASLLSSAITRDKLSIDFQANLDVARQNQQQANAKNADSSAMNAAITAASQAIDEYLAQGPVAYMRKRILEDLNLTEEDLAKMSPQQRDAVEKTIAKRMTEMLTAGGSGIDDKYIQAQLMAVSMRITATPPTQSARKTDTDPAA